MVRYGNDCVAKEVNAARVAVHPHTDATGRAYSRLLRIKCCICKVVCQTLLSIFDSSGGDMWRVYKDVVAIADEVDNLFHHITNNMMG